MKHTTLHYEGADHHFSHDDRVEVYAHSLNGAPYARCSCCESSDYARRFNAAKAHKSWCDLRGKATVAPVAAPLVATTAAPESTAHGMSASELRAAAKRGDLAKYASTDEIVDAVRAGVITESDAMNSDV